MRRAFIIAAVVSVCMCGRGYSEGERAGTVTKFSYKGLLWKSWEGTMNMGGMRQDTDSHGNSSLSPNVWDFTVISPEIADKIKAALESGKPVQLQYVQWWQSPCSMGSDYEVVAVKP